VAEANHVCTILHTVIKLPFYILLRAALCCVNLYWVWGAYCLGVRWLLAQPVYSSFYLLYSYIFLYILLHLFIFIIALYISYIYIYSKLHCIFLFIYVHILYCSLFVFIFIFIISFNSIYVHSLYFSLFISLYSCFQYIYIHSHFSTQGFLGFPVSISKCWDGSQYSKLPLHAFHVALPT